jgi:TPR repeat protein
MHMKGVHVGRDYKKAFDLYSVAAQHQDLFAMYNLGLLHQSGIAVARDCEVLTSCLRSEL